MDDSMFLCSAREAPESSSWKTMVKTANVSCKTGKYVMFTTKAKKTAVLHLLPVDCY